MNAQETIFCFAKVNEKIQPLDRGEVYEDPLMDALEEKGWGSISGGGTLQTKAGEIAYAGIDIDLVNREAGVPFVCRLLEELGAPKGSVLEVGDERFPFGQMEAIAVYCDGVNLPDAVYRETDINVVWAELEKRIQPKGKIKGSWQGPAETALYLYGESAEEMRQQIADFLASYPLCQGARVVTFAPPATAE